MTKNTAIISISLLFFTACSSSHENSCPTPAGTYHIEYTTLSGNCGEMPSADMTFPSTRLTPSCTITGEHTSDDNCSASGSQTCNFGGAQFNIVTTADTDSSGDHISGHVSISGRCRGEYSYSGTRTHQ